MPVYQDTNLNMIAVIDANGITQAQNTLDGAGRVIQQVRPDGGTLNFSYTLVNPTAACRGLLNETYRRIQLRDAGQGAA